MGKATARADNLSQGWRGGNKRRSTNEKRMAKRKTKKRGNPY